MKNNYKIFLPLFILLALQCLPFFMQGQVTTFEKTYYTPMNQNANDVLQTSDGGYMIAGSTVNNTPNDLDIRVLKTDNMGDTVWTKTYPVLGVEYPNSMLHANDGNYFILGYSQSPSADINIYLLKIDPSGNIIWSKTYGGSGNEDGNEIIAASDGNYVITGGYSGDAYLMKIDPAGTVIWTKYYGGSGYQSTRSVKQCLDGGFILTGKTSNSTYGKDSIFLVKTNSSGDTAWTKIIGAPNSYQGKFILANSDGTYTFCVDDSSGARDSDVRVMKTDGSGNIIWNKFYGGDKKDIAKMIQPTSDGGYVIASISRSFGWINPDMWVLKLTSAGDTSWTRHYGSWYHEHCYAVRQTSDGGYIAIGHTENMVNSNLVTQIMLVKSDANGNVLSSVEELAVNNSLGIYPNPTTGIFKIDMGGDLSASTYKIFNMLGQEVVSGAINSNNQNSSKTIDMKDKDSGIYFVTVRSEKYLTTKKIILK